VDFLDKTLRETKVIETSFGVFGRRPRRWGRIACSLNPTNGWDTHDSLGREATAPHLLSRDAYRHVDDGWDETAGNRLDRRVAEALNLSLAGRLLWIRFTNRLRGRRGNIATHYDKEDDSLFETFLDPRLVYSCGFVTDPQAGIDAARRPHLREVLG
jgi:hypothetical protein